jgi:hypothetical protein
LKPGGVFVVRIHDATGKCRSIIDTIETNFDLLEKSVYNKEVFVLAFRPLANRHLPGPAKEAVSFSLLAPLLLQILRSLGSVARVVVGLVK